MLDIYIYILRKSELGFELKKQTLYTLMKSLIFSNYYNRGCCVFILDSE